MGIYQAAFTLRDDHGALADEKESRCRQDQTETLEGLWGTDQRSLQLKTVGLVVEKILLDIKAQAILLEGLQAGGFVPRRTPGPSVFASNGPSQGQMDVPKAFLCNLDVVPKKRVSGS